LPVMPRWIPSHVSLPNRKSICLPRARIQ
jgi:hypothetical protein